MMFALAIPSGVQCMFDCLLRLEFDLCHQVKWIRSWIHRPLISSGVMTFCPHSKVHIKELILEYNHIAYWQVEAASGWNRGTSCMMYASSFCLISGRAPKI